MGRLISNGPVEEKSGNQLELSARAGGWGGIGLTRYGGDHLRQLLDKNIFHKEAWQPLPEGDGQKTESAYTVQW